MLRFVSFSTLNALHVPFCKIVFCSNLILILIVDLLAGGLAQKRPKVTKLEQSLDPFLCMIFREIDAQSEQRFITEQRKMQKAL